jgi:hypothetical protein
MITIKGKAQTSGTLVPVSIPESYIISHNNILDRTKHYLNYVEIMDMFKNEILLFNDPYIKAYINIRKIGIHTIVACPEHFPYNDVAKWCFSYLQKDIGLILNVSGLPITSLKADDIRARYQPLESTVTLNDSFSQTIRSRP